MTDDARRRYGDGRRRVECMHRLGHNDCDYQACNHRQRDAEYRRSPIVGRHTRTCYLIQDRLQDIGPFVQSRVRWEFPVILPGIGEVLHSCYEIIRAALLTGPGVEHSCFASRLFLRFAPVRSVRSAKVHF